MFEVVTEEVLDEFFAPNGYRVLRFSNSQDFDRDGFRGRARSSSYVPSPGHPAHERFFAELERIYEKYAAGGIVRFEYTTRLFCGRVPHID